MVFNTNRILVVKYVSYKMNMFLNIKGKRMASR
jgi:hypothetical protein